MIKGIYSIYSVKKDDCRNRAYLKSSNPENIYAGYAMSFYLI